MQQDFEQYQCVICNRMWPPEFWYTTGPYSTMKPFCRSCESAPPETWRAYSTFNDRRIAVQINNLAIHLMAAAWTRKYEDKHVKANL